MLPPPLPKGTPTELVRQLTNYHVATPEAPVPARMGVSYVWAGNGVFKYGRNGHTEAIVHIAEAVTPGLPLLNPTIAWAGWEGRLPAELLEQALAAARLAYGPKPGAGPADTSLVPIEAQFLIALDVAGRPFLGQAQTDEATAGHVRYQLDPTRPFLVDIHSHHMMDPFFSLTDDGDDAWLTASVVIGRIFDERPALICRLNVYGARQIIPAALIFDGLGPFTDVGQTYAFEDTAEQHAYRGLSGEASTAERATWWGALVARKVAELQLDPGRHDEDAKELLWFVGQALNWSPARQAAYLAGVAEGANAVAKEPVDDQPAATAIDYLVEGLDVALTDTGLAQLSEGEQRQLGEELDRVLDAARRREVGPRDLFIALTAAIFRGLGLAPEGGEEANDFLARLDEALQGSLLGGKDYAAAPR